MGLFDKLKTEPLQETDFHVFTTNLDRTSAKISTGPRLPPAQSNWMKGSRLEIDVPTPLVYEIDAEDEGTMRPYFKEPGAPLMSNELLGVLRAAGVDNIDAYDAIVRETRTGREYKNYKAVNIVGLVRGADMAKSKYESSGLGDGDPLVDLWFEKLVLDESKVRGHLFFRLAENVAFVLAHRSVKDAIESADIPGREYLAFAHPSAWKG